MRTMADKQQAMSALVAAKQRQRQREQGRGVKAPVGTSKVQSGYSRTW